MTRRMNVASSKNGGIVGGQV